MHSETERSDALAADMTCCLLRAYKLWQNNNFGMDCIKMNTHSFHILNILSQCPSEQLSMTELANMLQMTKQQLSKLINDLEDKELVERIRYKSNRRIVMVTLSDTGQCIIRDIESMIQEAIRQRLSCCSPEDIQIMYDGICKINAIFLQ